MIFAFCWNYFYDKPFWAQCIVLTLETIPIMYCGQILYYLTVRKPLPPIRSRLWSLMLLIVLSAAFYIHGVSHVTSYRQARERLPKDFHQKITNEFRRTFAYAKTHNPQEVFEFMKELYRDYLIFGYHIRKGGR